MQQWYEQQLRVVAQEASEAAQREVMAAAERWLEQRQAELVAESNRQVFAVMRDAAEQIAIAKRAAAEQVWHSSLGPVHA